MSDSMIGETPPATKGVTEALLRSTIREGLAHILVAGVSDVGRAAAVAALEDDEDARELLDGGSEMLAEMVASLSLPPPGEGAEPVGWAYQDARWIDEGRWHLCMTEPRAIDGRTIKRVFLEGSTPTAAVKVKPLEWQDNGLWWLAETAIGDYRVNDQGPNWTHDRFWLEASGRVIAKVAARETAQFYAQQDLEFRILSALASPQQGEQPSRALSGVEEKP